MGSITPPLGPLNNPGPLIKPLAITLPATLVKCSLPNRVLPGPGMQEMLPVLPLKHCRKSLALPLPDSHV